MAEMAKSDCPERENCIALKGAPIGMYHCPYCGAMVLAGLDTAPFCEREEQIAEPRNG